MRFTVDVMDPEELSLLFSSWLKSHRETHPETSDRDYYARQHDVIQGLVEQYPLLLVARNEGVVLGWLCARATDDGVCVDYAYTKSAYRRFGIARELLTEALERLDDVSGDALVYSHRPWPEIHEDDKGELLEEKQRVRAKFMWLKAKLDDAGFEHRGEVMRVKRQEARL